MRQQALSVVYYLRCYTGLFFGTSLEQLLSNFQCVMQWKIIFLMEWATRIHFDQLFWHAVSIVRPTGAMRLPLSTVNLVVCH